ncbi:MAG TPA: hypothetical protein VFH70_11530, partial [Acidimicrobiales bacterium]|nr:hypothetical protein [Acidimicrobiales bacterium]
LEFDRLAREAAAEVVAARRIELGLRALDWVRGPVLEHESWHGIDPLVWEINARIDDLASVTAATALEQHLPELAAAACRQALLAIPRTPRLWLLRRDASRAGSGESEGEVRRMAKEALGCDI